MLTEQEIKKVQKTVIQDTEDRLPFVFEALSDPTRFKIFQLLRDNQDLCVTDLAKVLKVSMPAISYQLRLMEVVGLVEKERMGKMICYTLKAQDPIIKKIIRMIEK